MAGPAGLRRCRRSPGGCALRHRSGARARPAVLTAGAGIGLLATHAIPRLAGPTGLLATALLAWMLRFRISADTQAWRRGAAGERRTARLLSRDVGLGAAASADRPSEQPSSDWVQRLQAWPAHRHAWSGSSSSRPFGALAECLAQLLAGGEPDRGRGLGGQLLSARRWCADPRGDAATGEGVGAGGREPRLREGCCPSAARADFTTTVASSARTLARRCRRADAHEPAGSAGAVVPALVFPAVDLACAVAGTLVFGAVDF
jgi:hypothetical protein